MNGYIIRHVQHNYFSHLDHAGWRIRLSPSTGLGWFQPVSGGRKVTFEFDGNTITGAEAALPKEVAEGLRLAGYHIVVQLVRI